ncbi:MAG: MerC domain-containing protein [Planctomycetota bacterium]
MSISATPINQPASELTGRSLSSWGDWIGMVASIGCAVHCAAMPFVIAFLPALGLSFLADEAFHQWMAVVCFAIALAAFVPGFRKHRRVLPAAIGTVGLSLICTAAFGMAGECCPSCAAEDAVECRAGIEG